MYPEPCGAAEPTSPVPALPGVDRRARTQRHTRTVWATRLWGH